MTQDRIGCKQLLASVASIEFANSFLPVWPLQTWKQLLASTEAIEASTELSQNLVLTSKLV